MEHRMRTSLVITTLLLAAAVASPAGSQTGGVAVMKAPGAAGIARTVNVTATITAIDASSREVTLTGPAGRQITLVAEPEVKNFSQLKTGDKVDVQYIEALSLELKKGGGLPVGRTEQAKMDKAPSGSPPAAAAGRRLTVVGDVVGLDPQTQTVTVRGVQRTVELRIPDPEQFKRIATGDQIEARYVEAAAVSIVPQK
jgi:Cu/Ag efflux protein CusF